MYVKVLTIAGFDGSSGAGLPADLKTFAAFGCYGLSILTAVPIQNTRGVQSCYQLPIECLAEQFDNLLSDIRPDSFKMGMLFNEEIIDLLSHNLKTRLAGIPAVLDPVMMAKSGHALLKPEAVQALRAKLLPLVALVTPNLPEAEVLIESKIENKNDMLTAARKIISLGPQAALIKGGHLNQSSPLESADLLLIKGEDPVWLTSPRIATKNDHGTGCALSAAIAANLALGHDLTTSCQKAKAYLTKALEAGKDKVLGHGHGPVHHFHEFWK